MSTSITDHDSTPTTTQQLLDHLVEQGYPTAAVQASIERVLELGIMTVDDSGAVEPPVLHDGPVDWIGIVTDHTRLSVAAAERNAATLPACPSWCSKPAGHLYQVDLGDLERIHERDFLPAEPVIGVTLSMLEIVDDLGSGDVRLDGPHLYVDGPSGRGITSAEARRLSVALLEAADTLDGPR